MDSNCKFISQVNPFWLSESYENEEILQAYEEAVEEGKDASNVTIDDFELLKLIGKGGYSQVFMARKKDSGQMYAIKIMDKKHLLSCMTPSAIVREVEINRKCQKKSLFVIDLYWAFQNETKLFLVMDLCVGGQLFYFLSQRDKLTEGMASFYIVEVMEALEILHSQNMLYRDLKPENILI